MIVRWKVEKGSEKKKGLPGCLKKRVRPANGAINFFNAGGAVVAEPPQIVRRIVWAEPPRAVGFDAGVEGIVEAFGENAGAEINQVVVERR